jgi:hypothetical protein
MQLSNKIKNYMGIICNSKNSLVVYNALQSLLPEVEKLEQVYELNTNQMNINYANIRTLSKEYFDQRKALVATIEKLESENNKLYAMLKDVCDNFCAEPQSVSCENCRFYGINKLMIEIRNNK